VRDSKLGFLDSDVLIYWERQSWGSDLLMYLKMKRNMIWMEYFSSWISGEHRIEEAKLINRWE
jgi:hypothetical protein